jgi:ribosomal protein RSM22 (predicted rRNA methylase)
VELPRELRIALDGELESLSTKKLAAVAADLSQRYRADTPPSGGRFVRSREDILAYAAFRLPATFGAIYAALGQVQERLPQWEPQSLADIGAGPGTATWAASTLWPDLQHVTLFEREDGMIALGKSLAAHSSLPAVEAAAWRQVDLIGAWDAPQQDLALAAYLLGELPQATHTAFIQKLWEMTSGVLVIIEPGTPAGFARIKQAREQLLATGAHTIAPCPHDLPCPMQDANWCHFSQRVARSRLHRQVKGGDLSYEDEKFAFVAMSRMSVEPMRGRIIRHPQIQKGHIDLELCTPNGLSKIVVTRRDREQFRQARDLRWGNVMPSAAEVDE